MSNLVIVESPTKAKTISKFLGRGFTVKSSFGHVRDLPKSKLGVDVEHDFEPQYVVPTKAKKVATELKAAAKKADLVYFASDGDREGEAIAWHLKELLDTPEAKTKRIVFHEITKTAIDEALEHPRSIDPKLVDAQQARRVLDRLVGYRLSPFLWKKVVRGISAGRVQSVAVRMIVEREREIEAFKPQEYWSIEALLNKRGASETFSAKLLKKDGASLDKFALPDEASAKEVVGHVDGAAWKVASIEKKNVKRSPNAPFTTSTLQQEGNNKLGYSAKQTMMLAQQLYEGIDIGDRGQIGLITYMRTDSVNLAEKFVSEAREWVGKTHGKEFVPADVRTYKTKSKGAQEAHEAIRPTDVSLTPDSIASHLDARQYKLYDLIWRRAVASQMVDAEMETVAANIETAKNGAPTYTFRANGSAIAKMGFMEVYGTDHKENLLPDLAEGDAVDPTSVETKQHFTEPPPRYTEASLVKALEEYGIGRPSTYAPTITTVVDRGYVEKDQRKLKPTDLAKVVNDLLVEHFADIVDLEFTARMENDLDEIAEGKKEWVPIIRAFYGPFEKNLAAKEKEVNKKDVVEQKTDEKCPKCGKDMVIKMGRFGKFLACTGYPECKTTKPIEGTEESEAAVAAADEKCDLCGKPMVMKRGRFGPFFGCSGYPECKGIKSMQKKVGVTCPKCNKNEIVEKRSKRGRTFYACSGYPECQNAYWSKPTGEKCPKCGALVVFAKAGTARCSDKECDFVKTIDKDGAEE